MATHDPSRDPAPRRHVLDLYLAETRQLFNSMDPSPFQERDLDPKAEAYIVEWAGEAPPRLPLGLMVHLGRETRHGGHGRHAARGGGRPLPAPRPGHLGEAPAALPRWGASAW